MFGKKKCKTAGEEEEKEGSSDKSETSDSESESEEESGGGLSEFDVKRSHTCYAYDKKKKLLQEMEVDGLEVQLRRKLVINFL